MKYILSRRNFSGIKKGSFFSFFLPAILFLKKEFFAYVNFLQVYTRGKVFYFSEKFEANKSVIVRTILIKRGKRNRFFLHVSAMSILTLGVLVSPFIRDPFSRNQEISANQIAFAEEKSLSPQEVFETEESVKPRSEIVTYTVQKGDTLSGVADRFNINEETIEWQNDINDETINVGDELEILPVAGIAHKVKEDDTIYSIAEEYDANAQAIVDFPFNDFADPQTFSLVVGQIVIVPGGVQPEAQPTYIRRQPYVATGPVETSSSGFTWPVQGTINQYYAWYHQGVDIGADVGTPVVASTNGTVSATYPSGWHGGYGTHVIIEGSNGYTTLYAHMSGVNVSTGQRVTAGSTVVGWIGMTGRTTGPHLHFEVRGNGGFANPLGFLQ